MERYYFTRLISNTVFVLICTIVISVTNYLSFILLIILNLLIYNELRRVIARRKQIIGQSSYQTKTDDSQKNSNSESFKSPVAVKASISGQGAGDISLNAMNTSLNTGGGGVSGVMRTKSREAQERKSLRRSLIMTLWVSIIFSSDRLVKVIYRTVVLVMPLARTTFYLNAFSYICDIVVYSSFFFVYMKTNKIFKKKFYEMFLRSTRNMSR